jgi:asparagine synthase (glutamine-hydrolysing)
MYPYVAFIRDTQNLSADTAAREFMNQFRQNHRQWALLEEVRGLSLFHAPPAGRSVAAIELPAGGGVILGTLFPRNLEVSPRGWNPEIDHPCAAEIVRTRGRHLMNQYWGGYVAFLADRNGTVHHVVRDCSGKVPCYVISHGDITIVTANIDDLSGLALPRFSINSRFLAGFIYNPELSQRECALNEVQELLAGECLELNAARAKSFACGILEQYARTTPSRTLETRPAK